jgi:hypothetical protein
VAVAAHRQGMPLELQAVVELQEILAINAEPQATMQLQVHPER